MLHLTTLTSFRRARTLAAQLPPLGARFGVRGWEQVQRDLATVVRGWLHGEHFQFDVRSAGLIRPDLSLPTYAGLVPEGGLAPIYNLLDRTGGATLYTTRVSRGRARDFRGGRLSYDDHRGTDFVTPVGMPIVAAAPGIVALVRDRWLRGGLTLSVDHGHGVVTQYSHLSQSLVELGQIVRRGEPIALGGASGYDLVQFFPYVPPHVHFMVWMDGQPVDPFLAPGEAPRPGCWCEENRPLPSGPLPDDPLPEASPVDELALERITSACIDPLLREELAQAAASPVSLAALLEDALHHQFESWPQAFWHERVRPPLDPDRAARALRVRISLPLPSSEYTGARFADAPWTAPPA
ncbi:MAG: M23 family metallopeptidase [Deltaproteobacteria bacterium]|nr:M23 family metallopeptidase [Deltaproteobacteria bacterium]